MIRTCAAQLLDQVRMSYEMTLSARPGCLHAVVTGKNTLAP